jgi:hypothetical protein
MLSTLTNENFDDYFVFLDSAGAKSLTGAYGQSILTNVNKI